MLSIHRGLLYKALGIKGSKMSANFTGVFENMPLYTHKYDPVTKQVTEDQLVVTATVIVRPAPVQEAKSSTHRIHLVCPTCQREIPFGRYHQHAGSNKCMSSNQQ